MDPYSLSVIMPLYNQEELFKTGLDSIPNRDDIEIIIIDDSSTDNSFSEAQKYPFKNKTVLRNDKNMGAAYSMNRGLELAQGKYILRLDSDGDYIENLEIPTEGDIVYFRIQTNNGDFLNSKAGANKFIRREFIGDLRYPPLVNCEDNDFYRGLLNKNPVEYTLNQIIYHYNYPRKGSLTWNVEHNITPHRMEIK